jgi:hypothetical protein
VIEVAKKKAGVGPTPGAKDEKSTKEPTEHENFIEELRRSAEQLRYLHPITKTRLESTTGSSQLEADLNYTQIQTWVILGDEMSNKNNGKNNHNLDRTKAKKILMRMSHQKKLLKNQQKRMIKKENNDKKQKHKDKPRESYEKIRIIL